MRGKYQVRGPIKAALVIGSDGDQSRRDACGCAGGGIGSVIAGICPDYGYAAYGDRLACANVFVGECCSRITRREAVAGHPVVGKRYSRVNGAVIRFVHTNSADDEGARGDVGSGGGTGRRQDIIAAVGAAQAETCGANVLAGADILVVEGSYAAGKGDIVAAENSGQAAAGDDRARGAIVGFITCRDGGCQR